MTVLLLFVIINIILFNTALTFLTYINVLGISFEVHKHQGREYLFTIGYRFQKHRLVHNKQYWRCSKFAKQCKARCATILGQLSNWEKIYEHNHPPDKPWSTNINT